MKKEELAQLSVPIWDRLRAAVAAGDKDKAMKLIDETYGNVMQLRGILMDFIDATMSALAEKAGETAVYELTRQICQDTLMPVFGAKLPKLDAEGRIRDRISAWALRHGMPVEIEEDDEKYVFHIPCDTGGHLTAKADSGRTTKAYPWSCQQSGVVYYCLHCPVAAEVMAIEQHGYPFWITFPPKKAGEKCVQYHFKDVHSTPEEYYSRVGMEKSST
jgi:hypothetical protein